MDSYQAFERAIFSTGHIVKGVREADLSGRTPCSEWDVRALLNHIIGTLWLASGLFADRPPRHTMGPGQLPETDLFDGDPAGAYAEASTAALASAALEGALTSPHQTPLGEMPGPVLAGFTTLDVFVHGWDLAQATNQPGDLDGKLAAHVLEFAVQALPPETRPPVIGQPVAVPEDAPVVDRLVAYLGRHP
ncbi:MAG: TIGR03086 family metal-binding protein [Actinomycetota bacterium]|nr:TIGR03086 family metal-binding protein [Actinomycetota bacterium]